MNPIDDRDLAKLCVDATLDRAFGERTVDGPEVLTRQQLIEAMFTALDKPPKIRNVPAGLAKFGS